MNEKIRMAHSTAPYAAANAPLDAGRRRQPPSATLTRRAELRPCQRDPPTSGRGWHLLTVVEIRYDVRNVWAAFELPHPDAALLPAPNPRSLAIRHDRHPLRTVSTLRRRCAHHIAQRETLSIHRTRKAE